MQALSNIKIASVAMPHLAWAEGLSFSLPEVFANHVLELAEKDANGSISLKDQLMNQDFIDLAKKAMLELRSERSFTNIKPTSTRLPINYQMIPSWLRDFVAHSIGRIKRKQQSKWAKFPAWPLDLSADFAADLGNAETFSYRSKPTPVLLTHDLDSLEGLENMVKYFLDIEQEFSAHSTNYIVPCGWPMNHQLLEKIFDQGHEIGIHGYDHSNQTPFVSTPERHKRLSAAKSLIDRYQIVGYRAPSLLRTEVLLNDLSEFYRYDSSIPTSGGLFPIPNNGCASARPFVCGKIWEIPISMPRDGSLLFLGYSPEQILTSWVQCAETIAASGGIINLLTHCEYRFSGKPTMRKIYRDFLAYLANDNRYQFTLTKDLVSELQGAKNL